MISRFRRQDKSSQQSGSSYQCYDDDSESPEESHFSTRRHSPALAHTDTGKSRLSEFVIPIRSNQDDVSRQKERSRERQTDPLGLTVLHEPESSPTCDIIFVHGLGGTSRHTWSKNRDLSLFWPLEWLPYESELSSTRIMTFGYNAQFASMSQRKENILNISDFAKDLLFSMRFAIGKGERKLDIGTLPIIFVAHSMGGLVVKKAFVLGQNDEHYQDIVRATAGIVFLSTPHRGSNLAEILNKVLSACIFTFSPKQYISELNANSTTIQEINEQFRNIAPTVSIVSFFETLKTTIGPSQLMVCQRTSSILGYPGEISKPLDADHHDVCKFRSQQDPNYISVRGILRYLVGKHGSAASPSHDTSVVDDLHQINTAFGFIERPGDDLDFFSERRMPGSCTWADQDPDFECLLDTSPEPGFLYCTGRPGSGKSILASFIIQTAQERDLDFAFYFFRFGDEVKNNLNTLILSLAHQIASVAPEYRRRLIRLLDDGLNVPKAAPRLLWQKLFVATFFKLNLSRPFLIIIDGLDECDSAGLFLKFLEDLSSFIGPLRVLILCRETQALMTGFDRLSKKMRVLHHPLEPMKEDLRNYVNEEMATMHGDEEFKQAVSDELVRKADGNFLWATLVLNEVLQCHTEDAVIDALDEVPTELEPLYERMDATLAKCCRQSDREMGRSILSWISCSRYPLNLSDLGEALRPEYSNILDLKYTISRVCGEFLIVDSKGVVSMVHSSARDCLFQNPGLNYHIHREGSHHGIFTKCIKTMIQASPRIQKSQIKSQAFLLYAATSWPFHFEQAVGYSPQKSLLLIASLLKDPAVLSWMYVLAVAGQLRILVQVSKKIASFLKRIDRLDEERSPLTHHLQEKDLLSSWSTDLIRIVGKFGSHLTEQPKLIFKLVAPFCPESSMIFKQFGRQTGRKISISGLSCANWDDCLAKFTVHESENPLQIKCANRYFAILLARGTILLYHASTCEDARRFTHRERVLAWAFNQSCDKLVTYGLTKTTVWITASGQELYSAPNHRRSRALAITFAEKDDTLLTCCDDRVIRRLSFNRLSDGWQSVDGALGPDTFEGRQCGSPRCASFQPAATQIAVSHRAIPLAVWSLDEPGQLVGRLQGVSRHRDNFTVSSYVSSICWNPTMDHIIGIHNDGSVFKWHPAEGAYEESHVDVINVECSPDGKFFVTSSRDGTLRIWDFYHFSPVYQLSFSALISSFAIDPNDTRIYDIRGPFCTVWEPNALVRMWETEERFSDAGSTHESTLVSQVSEATFEALQPVTALAVDHVTGSYAVGNDEGLVTHFTKDGLQASELMQTFMTVEHICWSRNGRFVAGSGLSRQILVKELDLENPFHLSKSVMTAKEEDPIRQILLSNEGDLLLVVTERFLNIWSTSHSKILSTRPQSNLHYWQVCPSDSSKLIGFGFASVNIIDWLEPASIGSMTLEHSTEQESANGSVNQRPTLRMWQRPSMQYPASPGETDEFIDKTLLSLDGSLALTVMSQNTRQGRRSKRFQLMDLRGIDVCSATKMVTMPIPSELQAGISIALGFLDPNIYTEAPRRTSFTQNESSSSPNRAYTREPDHLLAFLDHSFWVCTYLLNRGRSGRIKRHCFLPRDWHNGDWLELATIRPDGVLLCPRNGEVALVENGLREEWLE